MGQRLFDLYKVRRQERLSFVTMRAIEAQLLEGEAESRLEGLVLGRVAPDRRVVRGGSLRRHPVHVHAFPRSTGSVRFLPTMDTVAALLTRAPDHLCREAGLHHVIILPESVATSRFLLTHIFLPQTGILAYYLYPGRWNEPHEISGPRSPGGEALVRPGLLESVLALCAGSRATWRAQKFVVPLQHVAQVEFAALDAVAESSRWM